MIAWIGARWIQILRGQGLHHEKMMKLTVLNQLQNVICGAGPAGFPGPGQILGITWETKLCSESCVRGKDFFQRHAVLLWQILGFSAQKEISNHVVSKPQLVEQKVAMAFATGPALTSEESHRLVWIQKPCHSGVMHVMKHPCNLFLPGRFAAHGMQLAHSVPNARTSAFFTQDHFQNAWVPQGSVHDN